MKVYIWADLEGVAGVNEWDDFRHHKDSYAKQLGREAGLMVREVNAAVKGAVEAGASQIIVRDGHGYSNTIPIEQLHPRAWLSQGGRTLQPLPHLDSTYAAFVMIGCHAMAGNANGCLSHTYSRRVHSIRVNESTVGEIALFAAMAGELGVPTVFVSGDTEAVREARQTIAAVSVVETKVSHSRKSSLSKPLDTVAQDIMDGVEGALRNSRGQKPFCFKGDRIELAVTYLSVTVAIARFLLRGGWRSARLKTPSTVVYAGKTLNEVWRNFIHGAKG